MKQKDRRIVGRYVNPATGLPVNVWQWLPKGGQPMLFWYRYGKPQLINRADFMGRWKKSDTVRMYR